MLGQNQYAGRQDQRGGTAWQCVEAGSSASARARGIWLRPGAGTSRLGCRGMVSSGAVPAEVDVSQAIY